MNGSIFTTIPLLALAGALVGCGERATIAAPTPVGNADASAALVTDQPYQWEVSCSGDEAAYVHMYWFVGGVRIDSLTQYVVCPVKDKLTGSGVRPGAADAFQIAVGTANVNHLSHEDQTWTVDPNAPFSAQLNYSFQDAFQVYGGKLHYKVSGQVKVSS